MYRCADRADGTPNILCGLIEPVRRCAKETFGTVEDTHFLKNRLNYLKKSGQIKMSSLLSGHHQTRFFPQDGNLFTKPQQVGNRKHQEVNKVTVLPRSVPPTNQLSAPREITFDLPHDSVDVAEHMYLKFVVTNNDGANALHPVDGFTMVNYIDILCNNKSVQRIYGQMMRKEFCLMSDDEHRAVLAPFIGLSADNYGSNVSIAANGSKTFRVPIHCLLSTGEIPIWSDRFNWRVVVTLKGGSDVVRSTSAATVANTVFSECELVLDGLKYETNVRAAWSRELSQGVPLAVKYVNHVIEDVPLGGTTSGSVSNGNISTTGSAAAVFADLLSSTVTNEAQHTPSAITTMEIVSNGKVVSHGDSDNSYNYAEDMVYNAVTHWPNPQVLTNLNCAYVSFCEEPSAVLAHGKQSGYFKLSGTNERVRLTPGATIASSVLRLYILCYSFVRLDYRGGEVEVSRNPTDF